ncbi:division/outer membrane stress-associated lipid-binding lipoprotein [Candidatus Curculioniphilus buchneri]|uniref:division/outer membrane stress-associated lipid-binding lipoprotein n=1 Tax=Candidatus Curculioniphilus buchneri TaxID=690594 RepID=UPI00376EB055
MNVHKTLLLLCSIPILQGCLGAMVIGGATAISIKTAIDPRTIGTQIDDSVLEKRIANALSKDEILKRGVRLVNTVYQCKVLLTGQVSNFIFAERAQKIVMNINGVVEIYNEIRKGQPISLSSMCMDAWITSKIRWKLLKSNLVKSSNVKIVTENNEVFLLGVVTEAEGKSVAEIASKTNGVKHVTTAFTYL